MVVEASTYINDFCKSLKIAVSNCGQLTSSEILISCLKCATASGSSVFNATFLKNAEEEFERLSSLYDSKSNNVRSVRRKTEGMASPKAESVVTSMLEGSSDKLDMKRVRFSSSQKSRKSPRR